MMHPSGGAGRTAAGDFVILCRGREEAETAWHMKTKFT